MRDRTFLVGEARYEFRIGRRYIYYGHVALLLMSEVVRTERYLCTGIRILAGYTGIYLDIGSDTRDESWDS